MTVKMKITAKFLFVFSILSLLLTSVAQAAPPGSFAPLVEKLSPAVVNISTTQNISQTYNLPEFTFPPGSPMEQFNELFKGQRGTQQKGPQKEHKTTSLGSGFIINPKGILVTNNHVVSDADEITVTMSNGEEFSAKVIGRDEKVDIAILKIDADMSLPYVKFGDSDNMRVGDWIIAIGNPYGLGGSVSAGIISARARDINVGPFDDFLQTDAAINRGNSGGPMFNTKGEVVGINTAIFSPSGGNVGIGFALPAALAKPIIDQIIQFGKARRAWLGVKIQNVSKEIAESLGMKEDDGALVLEVIADSPAESAGIEEGDVILKFADGKVSQMRKLPRIVAETPIGESVVVQVLRNGKVKNLRITLGEMADEPDNNDKKDKPMPSSEDEKDSSEVLGMNLMQLTDEIKKKYKINADNGLLIVNVDQSTTAYERAIRRGQIILKANQKKLNTIADFKSVIAEAKKQKRPSVLLLISNRDEARFIPLPIE